MSESITIDLDIQYATVIPVEALPTQAQFEQWLAPVFAAHPAEHRGELSIRLVDEAESRTLNHTYRGKDAATNVLSFPFEAPPGLALPLLGDLVICPRVVIDEAARQEKAVMDHFAHLTIHGGLHLLGYDHIEEDEADAMEALERRLLASLAIDDPYRESH